MCGDGDLFTIGSFVGCFVVSSLLLCACGPPRLPEPSAAQRVREQCDRPWTDDFYFPREAIEPKNELIDDTERQTYSRFLKAFNAPSLSCGDDTSTEAYRFLWMPSYRPAAVIFVRRVAGEWRAEAVEFEHPRTNKPWTVARRFEKSLNDENVAELRSSLARAKFWIIPPWENSLADDGAMWVIEGRLGSGYRVVNRPNPTDPSFKEAGRSFFRLAGLPIPPEAQSD